MRASFALCVKSVEHGEWKLAEDLNEIDLLQELFQPRYFTRIESQESQFFRSLQLGLIYQVFRNTEARTRGFPIGRESQPLVFDTYWRIYATHRRIHVRGCVKKTLITGGTARPCPTSRSAKTIPSMPPQAMRVCRLCHWQTVVACNFFQTPVIISRIHRRARTMGEIVFGEVSGCNGHLVASPYNT